MRKFCALCSSNPSNMFIFTCSESSYTREIEEKLTQVKSEPGEDTGTHAKQQEVC